MTKKALIRVLKTHLDGTKILETGLIDVNYAAYNDREIFEPLFASGEIHEAMRNQIEEPLHQGTLWSVRKFVNFHNEERDRTGKTEKYGHMVILKQVTLRCAWEAVSQDELDTATL